MEQMAKQGYKNHGKIQMTNRTELTSPTLHKNETYSY